ncbi:MAG: Outer membrane protein OprJ [Verrucomicrobia subdivision 3 bacterium]|nr:Outer membrane protein OprJ [Limisphaerales bacterium]MCS1417291.1 Outer membrane protein OprJ [Limisphaerales bacterium]
MCLTLCGREGPALWSEGACDPDDLEDVIAQLVTFCAAGMRAKAAKKVLAPIVLALGLVGCVSAPEKQAPPESLPIPEVWSESGGISESERPLWWEAFMSDELTALLKEGFAGNPDLQAMVARVEAAGANARIAGADLYPSLSAGLNGLRQKQNFIGFPIPGSTSNVLSTQATTYGLSLSTSWEIDLWGRVRAGRRAALADSEAALADLQMRKLSLAAQLSKAWVGAVAAAEQLRVAVASAESFRETAAKIEDRYEQGLRTVLELRLSVNSVATADALVEERRQQLHRALQQLELLLGRYPAGKIQVNGPLPPLRGAVAAGIPSRVVERRPDLVAAERRLAAADQRLWQSRAALFPQISLTSSTGTSTAELNDLLDTGFSVWSLAGNLAQPILQGGRLRAGVDLSKAQTREAAALYVGAVLQAFSEVEFALTSETLLKNREGHIRLAAAESEAALVLANRRYESGLEELINVLESQRRSLSDAIQVIDVQRARLLNRIDLYLALGGGEGLGLYMETLPENL